MILNAACGGTLDATDPFGTVAAVRTLARAAVLALTCAGLGACAGGTAAVHRVARPRQRRHVEQRRHACHGQPAKRGCHDAGQVAPHSVRSSPGARHARPVPPDVRTTTPSGRVSPLRYCLPASPRVACRWRTECRRRAPAGQRRSVSVRGSAAPWGRALPRVHAVTGSPGHGPDVPGQAHRRRPRFPTEAEPGARTEEPTLLASARSRRLLLASAAATLLCGRTGSAQPAPGSGTPTATNPEKTRTDRERTNSPRHDRFLVTGPIHLMRRAGALRVTRCVRAKSVERRIREGFYGAGEYPRGRNNGLL